MTSSQYRGGNSLKRDSMGRSMHERDLQDNTYNEMIPEQDESNETSNQYSMSMQTNMRNSMPDNSKVNETDHYQDYFNQWAKSFNG